LLEGPYIVRLPVEKIVKSSPHIVDNSKKEKEAKRKKFCYYNG